MSNAIGLKSYQPLFQLSFENVRGCFFSCLLAFMPFVIGVVCVDLFFWGSERAAVYFEGQPDFIYRVVDDGLNITLLLLLTYCWLVALKAVRLHHAGVGRFVLCDAARAVGVRLGSLFFTGVWVLGVSLLWSVLLVVPGVIYYFLCGFALVVNVVEEKNTREAVARSIAVIKSGWGYYLGGYLFSVMMWMMMSCPVWFLMHTLGQMMIQKGQFWGYNVYQYLALVWACGVGVLTIEFHYQLYKQLISEQRNNHES